MANINIRLPQFKGATVEEQMEEMKRYMYYLIEQLNWVLNSTDNEEKKK